MAKLGKLSEKKMMKVFLEFDSDKSGTVDQTELIEMMMKLKLGKEDPRQNEVRCWGAA